jgi:glycosyltransferase involved in cell wall biosynthesis
MKVTLVIPIYNELDHLETFLAQVDRASFGIPKELVFVDDCSTDGSRELLERYPFKSEIQRIRHDTNHGKGTALQAGIAAATGTIICIQDADNEYDLEDLARLIVPIVNEKADVVYGSRFRGSTHTVHRTFHYLANRFLTLLSNLFSGLYLTDMETCYKVFRADLIKNFRLESRRFGFEPEVTAKIARLRLRVLEYPISYYPRARIDGKKISWRDGVAAVWHIIRFNLFVPNADCFTEELPARYIHAPGMPRQTLIGRDSVA